MPPVANLTWPTSPFSERPACRSQPATREALSPPRSAIRVIIWGSARAALISLLSLFIISAGVVLGRQCRKSARLVARHEVAQHPPRHLPSIRMVTGLQAHGQRPRPYSRGSGFVL